MHVKLYMTNTVFPDEHTSQQGMSAKPSSNTKPASLEIDEYEGNEMQVNGEGTRGNEEREAMERAETKKRCNKASKAVESSMKRKTHEKGNNLSLERYVTCDVAFAGFAYLIAMDLILPKNYPSSCSPSQRMPSLASPLVKVTGKSYPWYCCQLLKIVCVQYHVPIAQVI